MNAQTMLSTTQQNDVTPGNLEVYHLQYGALQSGLFLKHMPVNVFSRTQTEGEQQGSRRLSAAPTWGISAFSHVKAVLGLLVRSYENAILAMSQSLTMTRISKDG